MLPIHKFDVFLYFCIYKAFIIYRKYYPPPPPPYSASESTCKIGPPNTRQWHNLNATHCQLCIYIQKFLEFSSISFNDTDF